MEQTTSATLPNILVLQYLKKSGTASPETLMKTETFVRQGYQRLLTFEVPTGGFSWWGESPANVMLSAYGLLEFAEMAKVIEIDPKILERTRAWLVAQRKDDGSFEEHRSTHTLTTGSTPFALTAFVAWSQLLAGAPESEVLASLQYLADHAAGEQDPYALALAANAFAAVPSYRERAGDLARRLVKLDGWKPAHCTLVCSSGDAGEIEVTALIALALYGLRTEPAAAQRAHARLVEARQAFGLWHTTTATVLALKAIIAEQLANARPEPFSGKVRVSVDDRDAGELKVSDASYDVVQVLDLKRFTHLGAHRIRLIPELSRPQTFQAQLVATAWVPPPAPAGAPPLAVTQTFDRTSLAVDDTLRARIELVSHAAASGSMVLLDLGIPPGFSVETEDLATLVGAGTLAKYELTSRQLILYLPPMQQEKPVAFDYRLRARFPVRAATPPSEVYEYYNPGNRARLPVVDVEVR